jgi:pimeloyl-ACP methyl ester carboxylesterase
MSAAAAGSADRYLPRRPARRSEIDGREGRLAVVQWGPPSDSPIVLLHGWMDCAAAWQLLVDCLPDDWPLLAVDWRGYGHSAPRVDRYWYPDHLAELDALLDAVVPGGRARLIGHSMGGTVAAMYGGIRPQRLAWLVNIEGFGMPEMPAAGLPGAIAGWLDALRAPPAARQYRELAELAAALRQRNPRLPLAHAHWLAAAWTEPVAGIYRMRADPRHELRSPLRYARADLEACWARIAVPVLLLYGAESGYLGRAAGPGALARWQGLIGQLEAVAIPEAGHLLPYEQPAAVADAIMRFAQRHA